MDILKIFQDLIFRKKAEGRKLNAKNNNSITNFSSH